MKINREFYPLGISMSSSSSAADYVEFTISEKTKLRYKIEIHAHFSREFGRAKAFVWSDQSLSWNEVCEILPGAMKTSTDLYRKMTLQESDFAGDRNYLVQLALEIVEGLR